MLGMVKGRFATLRELFKPTLVKVGGGFITALFVYDAASNQFELPKLGKLMGMSGNLLPWWGWLLILQAIFVYALFEYVRRLSPGGNGSSYDDRNLKAEVQTLLNRVAGNDSRFASEMDNLKLAGRADNETVRSNHDALQDRIRSLEDRQSQNNEALAAIYDRERMLTLAKVIDRQSLELGKPLAEGKVMNEKEWEDWKMSALHWESVVSQWANYAGRYYGREPMDDICVSMSKDSTKIGEPMLTNSRLTRKDFGFIRRFEFTFGTGRT